MLLTNNSIVKTHWYSLYLFNFSSQNGIHISVSVQLKIQNSEAQLAEKHSNCIKKYNIYSTHLSNIMFKTTLSLKRCLNLRTPVTIWRCPAPCPASASGSFDISTSSSDVHQISAHLSFIYYTVQSLINKIDVLQTEGFDTVALTETWFTHLTQDNDLQWPGFKITERKDTATDRHGVYFISRN